MSHVPHRLSSCELGRAGKQLCIFRTLSKSLACHHRPTVDVPECLMTVVKAFVLKLTYMCFMRFLREKCIKRYILCTYFIHINIQNS